MSNSLTGVDRYNFAYVECHELRDARIRNTPRTWSSEYEIFRYIQAEMKCHKKPLQYGYRPSSDEIHFLLEVHWPSEI